MFLVLVKTLPIITLLTIEFNKTCACKKIFFKKGNSRLIFSDKIFFDFKILSILHLTILTKIVC
ncbi:hypothetical protein B6D60_03220 [candidate division KSB1 bacterium 4484_87]|nr:MAG: hypothetical protein B6D60_03220 [candidate division KSB1 bacterium 4484_87]